MRWGPLFVTCVATSLLASSARADKWSETLDISMSARFAWLNLHRELDVAPAAEGVDALMKTRPHLHGEGPLMGGIGRMGVTLDGVRVGFGAGIVTASGLGLAHTPPAEGLSIDPGGLWGAAFEGYLGYTFGDPDEIRWLIEVRGALTVLQTSVHIDSAELGSLGATPLNAYLGGLELRTGPRIPLGKLFYVEAGIGISPLPADIGPERGSLFFAVGLPVPTSHAF